MQESDIRPSNSTSLRLLRIHNNDCLMDQGDAESADIHEGSPNQGMLTPPQPAPPASTADAGSEAEMSFRDLIDDDSDEEAKTHAEDVNNYEKALLASGQVLVDPEDLQVGFLKQKFCVVRQL